MLPLGHSAHIAEGGVKSQVTDKGLGFILTGC